MGGMVAQEFALQYPARTRSLILGCTSPGGPSVVRAERKVSDILMARDMSLEQARAAILPYIYDADTPREKIEEDVTCAGNACLRRKATPLNCRNSGVGGIQSYRADHGADAGYPRKVGCAGATGNGELIAARIPGAKLVLLDHASHLFLTDQTQAAHNHIREFL